jgi:acyl transferase domain-containing protein/SAM-dependent methyltransferase/acyl carrier protein
MNKTVTVDRTGLEIAVIGMAGRFPGAKSTSEFWENLKNGIETISFFSDQELKETGVSPIQTNDPNYVKARGFMIDTQYFDASFFGYAPFEAELMDPQMRFFHECSWEALEDAGYDSEAYNDLIGVYAGASSSFNWEALLLLSGRAQQVGAFESMTLSNKDFLSTRLSHRLNLKGPSSFVQTACSTSLVAIHLACRAILAGECHMALAGGVTILDYNKQGYMHQPDMIFSPDGHDRAFDEKSGGTLPGNGIGIVVLKWLKNAIRDRDNIYAVIKGSAINNDGKRKVGYTAPSVEGQAEAIRRAFAVARVEPESITYLEAHGTATALGDPVEIEALKLAFKTNKKRFCALGSVKTNMGHLDSAAGVAGFMKTVLALKHRLIPPNLHYTKPNPEIDFENSPFFVVNSLTEWKSPQYPLRAGVSSFGIGGTNAHVILEEAPLPPAPLSNRQYQLILLSAKTESALGQMTENLQEHFKNNPGIDLADAAYTLQVGRQDFPFRWMTVCSSPDETIDILSSKESGKARSFYTKKAKKVIFMFPGLGAQYVNMGRELYETEPVFRQEADRCFEILKPIMDFDIKEILYPGEPGCRGGSPYPPSPINSPLERGAPKGRGVSLDINRFEIAQLVIFILEYALAKLIMKWGIIPHAMIGYSFGEYTAACLSGVFSLEDSLKLVVSRGKLIGKLPSGAMLSVPLPKEELAPLLAGHDELALAIDNGSSTIIAGGEKKVDAFEKEMKSKRYVCTRLPASHALHSPMMEPIVKEHEKITARVTLNKPQIPYISNVTGTWISNDQATNPAYWSKHLRETVRFADGVKELVKDKNVFFVEVGPGRDLSSLVMRYIEENPGQTVLDLTRHPAKNIPDTAFLLDRIGRLWLHGVKPDWKSFYAEEKRNRLTLPTYPFERQYYWIERDTFKRDIPVSTGKSPASETKSMFYVPSWQPSGMPAALPGENLPGPGIGRLMFIHESDFSAKLVKQLKNRGERIFCVKPGTTFEKVDKFNYTINPREAKDYHTLLHELPTSDFTLTPIVHLWNITGICQPALEYEPIGRAQELGLYSLLHLARAIGERQTAAENQIQIKVITDYLQKFPGEEVLYPGKASILAAVKMIPQQYPNIKCQSIDIAVTPQGTWQEEELIEYLSMELDREPIHPVIAYRDHERLHQTFVPVQLSDGNLGKIPSRLKPKGVYIITGQIEGIAGEIAQYLAPLVKPKLLFIEDNFTPGIEENSDNTGNLKEETDFLNSKQETFEKQFNIKGIETFDGLEEALNEFCTCSILDYFRRNAIDMEEGKVYDLENLKKKLRILPKFDKFFDFFITVLAEDQMIAVEENRLKFLKAASINKDPSTLAREIAREYLQFSGTIRVIDYCRQHYSDALSGKIEAISVLYPGGEYIQTQKEYQDLAQNSVVPVYFSLFQEWVTRVLAKRPRQKKIRILEIGGGRGLLTRVLLPVIAGQNVEYHFTDIGNFFVINARKEAESQGLNFMEFGILDISADPAAQGYDYYSFDMIVGLNVVHATRSIEESLGNLKKLLVPGGLLGLMELTNPKRWQNMIDGLAEGWWYFEDERTRLNTPLMSLDTWEHFFERVGFQDVVSFPQGSTKRTFTDHGLIIGRQESEAHCEGYRENIRTGYLQRLEKAGAEIQIINTDLTDLEGIRHELARVESNWGAVNGVIQHIDIIEKNNDSSENLVGKVGRILETGIKSTLVLDDIFSTKPLDFHAICSVLDPGAGPTSKIGNTAALHFFDSFAHYKRSRDGRFVVSINWDPSSPITVGNVFGTVLQHTFSRVIASPVAPSDLITQTREYMVKKEEKEEKKQKKVVAPALKKNRREKLSSEYAVPTNRTEEVLANIWQEFLGIEPVGIYDDFLELGTDSLVFITIAAKIHKTLDVKVPIPEFLAKPTIKDLAAYIEGMNKDLFTPIKPAEKKEYYPLSSIQKRLFVLAQMEPDSTAYNIPLLLRVEGNISKEKFEDTSRKLIGRHESLRTSFTLVDDCPVQIVHDEVDFKIYESSTDVETTVPETMGTVALPGVVKDFIRPFDLSAAPLLRMKLLKDGVQKYILKVDMHHIISDGVSLNIFARDFMSLYAEEQISPFRIQYKDFAQWLNSEDERESLRRQAGYWHRQFTGEHGVPILKLPTDFTRPQVQSFEGGGVEFVIPSVEAQGLITLAADHGITLFVVMLAIFYVFLYKITNQEAIVVGIVTAGRRHSDLEPILGMFVNTLAIINFPQGQMSFKEFLEKVAESSWKAFENQDYPLEDLVDQVVKDRDLSRNPLFDVGLVFENVKREHVQLPGLKFARMGFERRTSQHDLSLLILETADTFTFIFEYCTKLFKQSTIMKFGNYFRKVLAAILHDSNILLKDIEIGHEYGEIEENVFDDDLGDF